MAIKCEETGKPFRIQKAELEFYRKNLYDPYNLAVENITREQRALSNDFKALKDQLTTVPKKLKQYTKQGDFTFEQAVRVSVWNKLGYEIPGLTKTDRNQLINDTSHLNQTITFNALAAKAVGAADFSAGATASSGLTVSLASSNTAVATIVSGNIHIVGAGTATITASQAGNTNYNAATSVPQTLTVTGPVVTNYAPTSSTILSGTINSGTFSNLATNNSSYILTNSTTSGTRILNWYGSTIISQSPASVTTTLSNNKSFSSMNSALSTVLPCKKRVSPASRISTLRII